MNKVLILRISGWVFFLYGFIAGVLYYASEGRLWKLTLFQYLIRVFPIAIFIPKIFNPPLILGIFLLWLAYQIRGTQEKSLTSNPWSKYIVIIGVIVFLIIVAVIIYAIYALGKYT